MLTSNSPVSRGMVALSTQWWQCSLTASAHPWYKDVSIAPQATLYHFIQAQTGSIIACRRWGLRLPKLPVLFLTPNYRGLFHILCIGYDTWQQYVQALRPLRLIGSRGRIRSLDLSALSHPLYHLSYRTSVSRLFVWCIKSQLKANLLTKS